MSASQALRYIFFFKFFFSSTNDYITICRGRQPPPPLQRQRQRLKPPLGFFSPFHLIEEFGAPVHWPRSGSVWPKAEPEPKKNGKKWLKTSILRFFSIFF